MSKKNKQIRAIIVERKEDECPDTSYLGEYSDSPTCDWAIDRKANGDMERGQFRYFNPAMSGEQTGNPDSPQQDYERCESLNRGDWFYLGIFAVADAVIGDVCQRIQSGGLWGIESDSEEGYLVSVEDEELSQLSDQLESLGFSRRQIKSAMAHVVRRAYGSSVEAR